MFKAVFFSTMFLSFIIFASQAEAGTNKENMTDSSQTMGTLQSNPWDPREAETDDNEDNLEDLALSAKED